MNKFNPKKLLGSKWTAVAPVRKEKHFIVTQVDCSEQGEVELMMLEAIISKRAMAIDWRDLKNSEIWVQGWK